MSQLEFYPRDYPEGLKKDLDTLDLNEIVLEAVQQNEVKLIQDKERLIDDKAEKDRETERILDQIRELFHPEIGYYLRDDIQINKKDNRLYAYIDFPQALPIRILFKEWGRLENIKISLEDFEWIEIGHPAFESDYLEEGIYFKYSGFIKSTGEAVRQALDGFSEVAAAKARLEAAKIKEDQDRAGKEGKEQAMDYLSEARSLFDSMDQWEPEDATGKRLIGAALISIAKDLGSFVKMYGQTRY